MFSTLRPILGAALFAMMAPLAVAQEGGTPPPGSDAGDELTILFETGEYTLDAAQEDTLDQASRLFRDGNPVVMIVTGTADTVGDARTNLDLSLARARRVADGLVDRGIPIDRLQVLGRGNSELPVSTDDEISNAQNRSVRITWR